MNRSTTPVAPPPRAGDARLDVQLRPPHLIVDLKSRHRCLSWALAGGGFHDSSAIVWREVRNRDLSIDVDPVQLLQADLDALEHPDAIGLLTSAPLADYAVAWAGHEEVSAHCVATVGLSNALAIGDPPGMHTGEHRLGTINIALIVSRSLCDQASVEALSLAAEARTVSVTQARVQSRRSDAWASGTGTDCIVVAAPTGDAPARYAGKHTALGSVIGSCVRAAVDSGIAKWRRRQLP